MLRLPDSSDFQPSLWELMLERYYHLVVGVIIQKWELSASAVWQSYTLWAGFNSLF